MAKRRPTDFAAPDDVTSDANAFRAAVRDVKPLLQTPPAAGLEKFKARVRIRKAAAPARDDLDAAMPLLGGLAAHESAPMDDTVTGEGTLAFHRAGVRLQVMRRLRRGLYPVEDELDLHGLTQTAARDRLADFLERSRDGGRRCVRIVHGKGYRSGVRGPVLKTAVNLWLRRHSDVLAFVSARAIDGGAGALYVLLRG